MTGDLFYILTNVLAILTSAVALFVAVRVSQGKFKVDTSTAQKNKADAKKANAEAEEITADTIKTYSEELTGTRRAHKEEINLLNQQHANEIKELQDKVELLEQENVTRDSTIKRLMQVQADYEEYIDILLRGNRRLAAQIQLKDETPVWTPPDPPFKKGKKGE